MPSPHILCPKNLYQTASMWYKRARLPLTRRIEAANHRADPDHRHPPPATRLASVSPASGRPRRSLWQHPATRRAATRIHLHRTGASTAPISPCQPRHRTEASLATCTRHSHPPSRHSVHPCHRTRHRSTEASPPTCLISPPAAGPGLEASRHRIATASPPYVLHCHRNATAMLVHGQARRLRRQCWCNAGAMLVHGHGKAKPRRQGPQAPPCPQAPAPLDGG